MCFFYITWFTLIPLTYPSINTCNWYQKLAAMNVHLKWVNKHKWRCINVVRDYSIDACNHLCILMFHLRTCRKFLQSNFYSYSKNFMSLLISFLKLIVIFKSSLLLIACFKQSTIDNSSRIHLVYVMNLDFFHSIVI